MRFSISDWIFERMGHWLLQSESHNKCFLCDFSRICRGIKPGDVLLIEGRTRASRIIKQVTQSPWSHAALYIGRVGEINNSRIQDILKGSEKFPDDQLLIESEVGLGTILSPISKYKDDHIRILRPQALTNEDTEKVRDFAITRLGKKYSVRHLFDLARFLFPWWLYPRRWRSSLFQHNAQLPTEDICSSMIADAFQSVRYPILPLVQDDNNELQLVLRNSRLFTPRDFDHSPYFDVIKYPIIPLKSKGDYHNLRWNEGVISNDQGSVTTPLYLKNGVIKDDNIKQFFTSQEYAVIGSSTNRSKFGNKVLRCYQQHNKIVHPVNPKEKIIEGVSCITKFSDLPGAVVSISIVTPPKVTENIVEQAIGHGIKNIWMQPGSESTLAIQLCRDNNINIIANGPCILVELGFIDSK